MNETNTTAAPCPTTTTEAVYGSAVDYYRATPTPCPSCGRCPTCGQGGYGLGPYVPYYPYYPYYPSPYWGSSGTGVTPMTFPTSCGPTLTTT